MWASRVNFTITNYRLLGNSRSTEQLKHTILKGLCLISIRKEKILFSWFQKVGLLSWDCNGNKLCIDAFICKQNIYVGECRNAQKPSLFERERFLCSCFLLWFIGAKNGATVAHTLPSSPKRTQNWKRERNALANKIRFLYIKDQYSSCKHMIVSQRF